MRQAHGQTADHLEGTEAEPERLPSEPDPPGPYLCFFPPSPCPAPVPLRQPPGAEKCPVQAASDPPRPICLCLSSAGAPAPSCSSCVPTRALSPVRVGLSGSRERPPRGIPALPQLWGQLSSRGPQASCLEEPALWQVAGQGGRGARQP